MSEPTKSRRAARESAFQAAYQCTVGRSSIARACEDVLERKKFTDEVAQFIVDLSDGMVTQTGVLDDTYAHFLKTGWTPERLAVTDLIVLRMAIVEFYDFPEIPPKVTITECVNIAKKFGTEESGRFINGILAKVLTESPKKDWPIIDSITAAEVREGIELAEQMEDEEEPEITDSDTEEEVPFVQPTEDQQEETTEEVEPSGWVISSDD